MKHNKNIFELLESRLQFSGDPSVHTVLIPLTGGNDKLDVYVSEYSDTRIVSWTLNGSDYQLQSPFYQRVLVVDSGGNDTINVIGAPPVFRIELNTGSGKDKVTVTQGLEGHVDFNGGTGDDKLVVDQSLEADKIDMKVNQDEVDWVGSRDVAMVSVENITIAGGKANDTYTVGSVRAGQFVQVYGGKGNDLFNVGNGDLDANILGKLSVDGVTGEDRVAFLDGTDTGNDAYVIESYQFSKPGVMANPIKFTAEQIDLAASNSSNAISIPNSVAKKIKVNGAWGNDTLTIGGPSLAGVANTSIDFQGSNGNDKLRLVDSTDTGNRQHVVKATSFQSTGRKTVTFGGVNQIEVFSGRGADKIDASASTVPTYLRGGDGNDTIIGSAFADNIWGDAGNDSLLGNDGVDTLVGGSGTDFLDGGPGDDVKID